MMNREFAKQFNEAGKDHMLFAEGKPEGMYIYYRDVNSSGRKNVVVVAFLLKDEHDWHLNNVAKYPVLIGNEEMDLMLKFACESFDGRLDRYVILNADPFDDWEYFRIGDKSEYLRWRETSDPDTLIKESYTLEELEKEKRWLPKEWRKAINSMLTPLDVALEMVKENKRGPKADFDRRIEVKEA